MRINRSLGYFASIACLLLPAVSGAALDGEPSCTLTSPNPVADFGTMRPSLRGGGQQDIKPAPLRRTYTASCRAATRMTLVFKGAAANANALRFGGSGTYTVRVVDARLDGAPVQMARVAGPGQPPSQAPAGELVLLPSDAVSPASGQTLVEGKRLDVTLEIAPVVPIDAMRIAQQVTLNAVANLELVTP